jgi:hypothetical protein
MDDKFMEYLSGIKNIYFSTDDEAMLIWGKNTGRENTELIGLSYNSPTIWSHFDSKKPKFRSFISLSEKLGYPILWIGKGLLKSGKIELGRIRSGAISNKILNLDEAANEIQNIFGTNYKDLGTKKQVNKRTAGSFHKWSRNFLPSAYNKEDIDILVSNNKDNSPRALVEIKRSIYYSPNGWSPYRDDIRNYILQFKVCNILNIAPILIYHKKGEAIENTSSVGYYNIKGVYPNERDWIDYDREIIKAQMAKTKLVTFSK